MHGTGNNVTLAGFEASTDYNGIAGSSINGTYTALTNITLDSYDVAIADRQTQLLQAIQVVLQLLLHKIDCLMYQC